MAMGSKCALVATVIGLAASVAGCNGADSGISGPSDSSVRTPQRSLVTQGGFQLRGLNTEVVLVPFSTATAGSLDVTVDWTFAGNDVDVWLLRGSCSVTQFVARACALVARADGVRVKPEQLTVSNAPAAGYTLAILNYGLGRESGTYQVFLTH